MKKILLVILRSLISIVNLFFNYNTASKIYAVKSLVYSLWISCSIKGMDKSSRIGCNCTLRGGKYIKIGKNSIIGRSGVITCWDTYMNERFQPSICIGDNSSIGEYCHITSINLILIGNNVLTGRWVTITDNGHGESSRADLEIEPLKRYLYSKGSVRIDDDVWIGDKVTVLAGVHIGQGAVIAANSVVTSNVLPFSVVGGIPAKILKQL